MTGDDVEANTNSAENKSPDKTTSASATGGASIRQRTRMAGCCDAKWKKITWGTTGVLALTTIIVLIAISLQKLESTEYGVEYHPRQKQLDDAIRTGGLHLGPPGYEFIVFPSTFITVDLPEGTCVSIDGLRIKYEISFQYQLKTEWVLPAVKKYRDFDKWSDVVEAAGNSAVQHACSQFPVSEFQSKRGVIQQRMEDELKKKLEGTPEANHDDGVYALAISLQLRNLDLPDEYEAAVGEKQAAEEDIQLAINQRSQETTKARTQLLAAKEQARKILDTAENDANVTVTRAELQAEETTYALQTEAQVLVRVKESLQLTTAGILSYMANKLYEQIPEGQLKVTAQEPAKLSRMDEL